jgi:hypothetical protein
MSFEALPLVLFCFVSFLSSKKKRHQKKLRKKINKKSGESVGGKNLIPTIVTLLAIR